MSAHVPQVVDSPFSKLTDLMTELVVEQVRCCMQHVQLRMLPPCIDGIARILHRQLTLDV